MCVCDVVTGQKGHDVLAQGVLVKVLYSSFFFKKKKDDELPFREVCVTAEVILHLLYLIRMKVA